MKPKKKTNNQSRVLLQHNKKKKKPRMNCDFWNKRKNQQQKVNIIQIDNDFCIDCKVNDANKKVKKNDEKYWITWNVLHM